MDILPSPSALKLVAAVDPFRTFASARSGQKARRCRKPDRKYSGQQGPLDWPAPLRALRLPIIAPLLLTGEAPQAQAESGDIGVSYPVLPFIYRGEGDRLPLGCNRGIHPPGTSVMFTSLRENT